MTGKGLTSLWAYAVGEGGGVLKGLEFVDKTVKYITVLLCIALYYAALCKVFNRTALY